MMKDRMLRWTMAAGAAAALTFGAGCATTFSEGEEEVLHELAKERDELGNPLTAEIQELKMRLEKAEKEAEEARKAAAMASRTADDALGAAREAQASGATNTEKLDRMFKRSMMK